MNNEKKLLKILCLHGYRQSGDIFKKKLGALRKTLKKHAEFVFITAPNQLPVTTGTSESSEESHENEQYGWWFSSENMTFDSKQASDVSIGFEKSVRLVEKTFAEQGPFDGLLGFSQGAAFAGILCGMQELEMMEYDFKFAILVAGFRSACMPHMNFFTKVSSVPSLHVYGEMDQVINKERSELLMEYFEDPEVIVHPGGHFVPSSSAEKQGYISFLEDRSKALEIEEMLKNKQIQFGSYVLGEVEDSGSNEENGRDYIEVDNNNSSKDTNLKTKSKKGGITKQRRKQKQAENQVPDKVEESVSNEGNDRHCIQVSSSDSLKDQTQGLTKIKKATQAE